MFKTQLFRTGCFQNIFEQTKPVVRCPDISLSCLKLNHSGRNVSKHIWANLATGQEFKLFLDDQISIRVVEKSIGQDEMFQIIRSLVRFLALLPHQVSCHHNCHCHHHHRLTLARIIIMIFIVFVKCWRVEPSTTSRYF